LNLPFTKYDLAERVSLIKTAMGLLPADKIITNVKLVEVNTGDILEGVCILIKSRRIAGIVKGDCVDRYRGDKTLVINGDGYYAMPGFIDLHVHIESSMLDPIGFSKLALKHGTTTIVADPHEIVNVLGLEGLKVFAEAAKKSPLKILLEVPSCVPPTDPSMNLETPASLFPHSEFVEALDLEGIAGLGEVMDFLSVINANEGVLRKIMHASSKDLLLDGHAPLLTPEELNAYISAGILSDHESTNLSEALEKAWRGMYLYIREGSAWRDLEALIDIVKRRDCKLCAFVSDDVNVVDLVEHGHMDRIINRAIELGLDPVKAIQLATINPALRLDLEDHIGIVAPGRLGDIVLSKRLERVEPETVMASGELIYYRGELVKGIDSVEYPSRALNTVKVDIETIDNMDISPKVNLESGLVKVNVIRVEPGSALTKHVVEEVEVSSGVVLPNPKKDVMYVGVLYRHAPKGGYSVGLIQNLNFKLGAVAQTVAHDTHNIIFAGWSEGDIRLAIKRVVELQGGIVVVDRGRVVAELPLRLAGLMSIEEPEVVYERYKRLTRVLKEHGSDFEYVFMTLSLVSLPVIPEIRITDKGLVNVKKGELLKLVVEQ
jgi:adenine deaminase